MRLKINSKFLSFVSIGVGIVFSLIFLLNLNYHSSTQDFYIQPALSASNKLVGKQTTQILVKPEIPVRLKIPKININVSLEQVGLTSQGAVDVPKGKLNAAWFNVWPRPGEIGSAIIVGHYGIFKNGIAAVFNNLSKLKPGDKIYVEDKEGKDITFVVRKFQTYASSDNAVDVFSSNDGQAHLNLITCEGTWNKISQSYSKRLIVFADLY
jgi:LPXTG-site transpeptidase (sortase) family protein